MGDENKNAKGIPEDMIDCAECGNCGNKSSDLSIETHFLLLFLGHPSCLQYSEKLVEKIKTIRWQCLDCKRCIICKVGDDSVCLPLSLLTVLSILFYLVTIL